MEIIGIKKIYQIVRAHFEILHLDVIVNVEIVNIIPQNPESMPEAPKIQAEDLRRQVSLEYNSSYISP